MTRSWSRSSALSLVLQRIADQKGASSWVWVVLWVHVARLSFGVSRHAQYHVTGSDTQVDPVQVYVSGADIACHWAPQKP
ncbi:hypothetical protein F4821DRAFT_191610 [Hypoxylon rubiginosum]|uniref:Uncharacterized protein n=1 Tax=Hypoxylon rubiginosum TaxID=110542 RepID=A0ACC0CT40_9PEZI|nr:hypothetical protein F4821DRAFT_191610 [Hypoxylon rubiginosum]